LISHSFEKKMATYFWSMFPKAFATQPNPSPPPIWAQSIPQIETTQSQNGGLPNVIVGILGFVVAYSYFIHRIYKDVFGKTYISQLVFPHHKDLYTLEALKYNSSEHGQIFLTSGSEWKSPHLEGSECKSPHLDELFYFSPATKFCDTFFINSVGQNARLKQTEAGLVWINMDKWTPEDLYSMEFVVNKESKNTYVIQHEASQLFLDIQTIHVGFLSNPCIHKVIHTNKLQLTEEGCKWKLALKK
jgi:hypothetical protein